MSTAEAKILESRAIQYRDYPEDLKASIIQAIEANGGNVLATARLFNIPPQTVDYWWRNSDRFSQIQKPSSENLADKLENIAHQAADSLSGHDLSIVSYRDKGSVLSTVIDKMQLLRGLPTSITEERVESGTVLVLMSNALGLAPVIDITPEKGIVEAVSPAENALEVRPEG